VAKVSKIGFFPFETHKGLKRQKGRKRRKGRKEKGNQAAALRLPLTARGLIYELGEK